MFQIKKTHIVAAHASYHGDLIEGEYQFTFGGSKAHNSTTGFLVPHSGRIRKIKNENSNSKENFEDKILERDRVDIYFIMLGFFDFINIKANGEINRIGIIRCQDAYKLYFQWGEYTTPDNPEVRFTYDFCFEDDLPLFSEETAKVEESDIINILTRIDLSFHNQGEDKENDYMGNTYLATILIEFDPL